MTNVSPGHSMELLGPRIDSLNADLAALTPQQWLADSSCAGWQIADLASHVVRNGWSILTFTQRALAGDPTPAFGPSVAHIQEEIKAAGARAAAERQAREHAALVQLVGSLSPADFEKTGLHPSGARTIAWGCTQRLAEVAFHHWDLRHSLGHDEPLPPAVAGYLLAFMMDPTLSPVMRKVDAQGGSRSIRLTSSEGGDSWLVSTSPEGRHVEAGSGAAAEGEISGQPGWLALALYGRIPPTSQHLSLSGPAAAEAFSACFA